MRFSVYSKISKNVFFGLGLILCSIFISCQKDEDMTYSFNSSMDRVDVFIRNNQINDALDLLKKSEKYAYNPMARIGLYKRYKRLGEKELCEKALKKALKKFPDSVEIAAVYGQFLLRENKINEAEKVSKILSGTKYGSIYSEAVLRKNASAEIKVYLANDFCKIYKDIFDNTQNPCWLVNASLVKLANGEYLAASLLQESTIRSNRKMASAEALFWTIVQFDAENYDICLRNVKSVTNEKDKAIAMSIASDCYVLLDELDRAEAFRNDVLSSSEVPNVVAVNSAIWAYQNKQYKRAYDLLMDVFTKNPEYIPALLTYGKIAWLDSRPIIMSDLEKTVRETELRTEKMRQFDDRPRFLLDDAIFRLAEVEAKYQKDKKNSSFDADSIEALMVERLSLYIRSNNSLPIKAKTAEIWKSLEKNESGYNLYPSLLVNYSVQKLISYGFVDEARDLFMNYINSKYLKAKNEKNTVANDSDVEVDIFGGERRVKSEIVPESVVRLAFGDNVAKSAFRMNVWEVEIAAYFALLDGNVDCARRLYEYVLFESGGVINSYSSNSKKIDFENISTLASPSSAVNLAMIYSSLGDNANALSLYGLAAGKCEDARTKSKILQRIASIQFKTGDIQQARLSVDYSLSLDSQNADTQLLKKQIQ